MMDNPNGDYGICRASNDRKKDEKCLCSMSDGKNSDSIFLYHRTNHIFQMCVIQNPTSIAVSVCFVI